MLKSASTHAGCVVLATILWLLCASAPAIAQISFVAASAPLPSSGAVSSVSAGPPAGIAANDVLLGAVSYRGGNAMGSAPSGWTLVTLAGGGQNVVTYVYRKVATASEPASYTWTMTSSARAAVVILAFRGVDASSPVADSSQNYSSSNSTSLVASQVTPGVANSMLVAFWAVTNGNATITPPSSMTERFNLSTGAGPNGLVLEGATESYAPTTATGTRTAISSNSEQYGAILLALRPRCGPTFTVTNTNNSGAGSLRQAITDANACSGTDTIAFNVSGAGCSGGACTISPTSALPAITDPVIIDGRTQPGYAGTPLVRVDGASASGSDGLRVNANSSTIAGLMITRFGQLGLNLTASNCVVIANYIGTNGTTALGNGTYGINVQGSSNTIGSSSAAGRNLISGNSQSGIFFTSGSSNIVQGN